MNNLIATYLVDRVQHLFLAVGELDRDECMIQATKEVLEELEPFCTYQAMAWSVEEDFKYRDELLKYLITK
jgi:hypothetical protein